MGETSLSRGAIKVAGQNSFDLATLKARYETGELTPSALVADVLDRIAARGDDHLWIDRLGRDELFAIARRLEAEGPTGKPLYGIPFAIKDNIDLAGHPTTAACPAFAYQARHSAHVVERLIGRRYADRQNQSRSVRDRPQRHALALRRTLVCAPSRLYFGRLELRFGGRSGGRARQLFARDRHGRIGAGAGGVQQCARAQADARPHQHARRGAGLPLARLRLDFRSDIERRRSRCLT